MSRKTKTRKHKQQARKRSQNRVPRLSKQPTLRRAQESISDGDFDTARQTLEAFDRQQPNHRDVLHMLLDIYHQQQDFRPCHRVASRLLNIEPNNRNTYLVLAGGLMATGWPVNAFVTFQRFLERWPDDPMASGVREQVESLSPLIRQLIRDNSLPEAGGVELMAMHENTMIALSSGRYPEVIRLGEQLLDRCPDFVRAKNNLTEAYFRTEQPDKAIETAKAVLQLDPGNIHAMANLARILFLLGRFDEAETAAEALRGLPLDSLEACVKAAETFSFFGDDTTILNALDRAKKHGLAKDRSPTSALLYHLAAVASARQGKVRTAERYWKRSIEIAPSACFAEENLEDIQLPPGERHGPWGYELAYWIPANKAREFAAISKQASCEAEVTRRVGEFSDQNPQILALLPAMLDRGDEASRQFAILFAKQLQTPKAFEVLWDHCTSNRGPDQSRSEVAYYLREKGQLPSDVLRMSVNGKWTKIEIFGFEVYDEPDQENLPSPKVRPLLQRATELLYNDQPEQAEPLLRAAMEIEPDQPSTLNNLASALELQGCEDEADELMHEIHRRWPDYFFGRIGMAGRAILDEEYEQAEAYLAPLRHRTRLHRTEYTALCRTHAMLHLTQRKPESAQRWLDLWRQLDPDNPEIDELSQTAQVSGALQELASFGTRKTI